MPKNLFKLGMMLPSAMYVDENQPPTKIVKRKFQRRKYLEINKTFE